MVREAVGRGLTVIPVNPDSKAAVEDGWQAKGYRKEEPLASDFSADHNLGALCSKGGSWIFDVDSVDWFTSEFPRDLLPSLETFAVKTGGGGYQFHFLQDDLSRAVLSNKSMKNPNPKAYKKPTGAECESVFDVLFDRKQGLLPGSMHPVTKKEYEVHKDAPLVPAGRELVDWIVKTLAKKPRAKKAEASPFRLRSSWKPEAELEKAGLKFDRSERDGKVFLNYHALMGKCLVKGSAHSEPENNRQSAFVHDPAVGQLWHECFSCEPGIAATKKALAELGIDYRTAFACDGQKTVTVCNFRDHVEKKHLAYLWPGYLPANKLVHFAGESTEGKSPVTVDLIARVSAGLKWPDERENSVGPRKVLLMAGEDDPEDTVKPRLELAGALLENVVYLKVSITKDSTDIEKSVALDADMEVLMEAARQLDDLALIVWDPFSNYLGNKALNKEEDMRQLLMPLSDLAREIGCCIVTVGHLNKRERGTDPLQRIMGAAAIKGVARFIYFFGPDPEDADKFAHVMVQRRGVGAKSLRYATEGVKVTWDGQESEVVRVVWRGFSEATSEDAVDPASGKEKSSEEKAAVVLKKFLSTGKKPSAECYEHMSESGFALQDKQNPGLNSLKVRKKAGVDTEQKDKKHWWFLAAPKDMQQDFGVDC